MTDTTPSGIRSEKDGTKYVGGSVRADGTVRKQVKVRPGFTPAEDVAKYVPRGKRLAAGDTSGSVVPKKTTAEVVDKPATRPVRRIVRDPEEEKPVAKPPSRKIPKDDEDLADQLDSLSIKEGPTKQLYIPPHLRNKSPNDKCIGTRNKSDDTEEY